MEDWNWASYSIIKDVYTEDFPLEVRILLEHFFRKNEGFFTWNTNNPSVLEQQISHQFIAALKNELDQQFQNLPSVGFQNIYFKEIVLRPQCERVKNHTNDIALIQLIQRSVNEERRRLQEFYNSSSPSNSSAAMSNVLTMKNRVEQTKQTIDNNLKSCEQLCLNIRKMLEKLTNDSTVLFHEGVSSGQQFEKIQQDTPYLDRTLSDALKQLFETQKLIFHELDVFTDKQRLVPVAVRTDVSDLNSSQSEGITLEDFENWFDLLLRGITSVASYLPNFNDLCRYVNVQPVLSTPWINQIKMLFITTFQRCVVFEQQPRQITRQSTCFPLQLRVLAPVDTVRTELYLVNRAEAGKVISQAFPIETCGEVIIETEEKGRKGRAKKTKQSVSVSKNVIKYPKPKLHNVIRAKKDRQNKQNVVEERFWIYCKADLSVTWLGQTEQVNLHILSQPIAITTHPVQDAAAWAQVVWINACPLNLRSNNGLDPPEKIEWKYLIEVIDQEFVKLGRSLTNDNKMFIKERLFRDENVSADEMVRKELFCGKTFATMLNETSAFDGEIGDASSSPSSTTSSSLSTTTQQQAKSLISFGEWLFYCINLLNPHTKSGIKTLSGIWASGKILGFISKEQVESKLARCRDPRETFIIRFPEKWPGHIGLYFYNENDYNEKLIKFCYTLKDLQIMSLEDRITDSPVARKLYSDFQVKPYECIVKREIAFPKGEASSGSEVIDDCGYVHNIKMKIKEAFSRKILDIWKNPSGNKSA